SPRSPAPLGGCESLGPGVSAGSLAVGYGHGGRGRQGRLGNSAFAKIPGRQRTFSLDQVASEFLEGGFTRSRKLLPEAIGGRFFLCLSGTRRRGIGHAAAGAGSFGASAVSVRELLRSGRVI